MLSAPFQTSMPMAAKEKTFYAQLGARIAERRKAQGITQVELAKALGIAQQTMAHYEGGVSRIAVSHLLTLARVLDVAVEELLGEGGGKRGGKRGPVPKLQAQIERIGALPRSKQRMLLDMLDAAINSEQAA